MTAAERARALLANEQIDCPACGAFPMEQEADFDLGMFGGKVPGEFTCPACGFRASRGMCAIAGQPGDDTAAIHLQPPEPVDGSAMSGLWDAKP